MAVLQDLPTETLILILRFLGAIDLQATILAQRVSKRFRDIIQDAVLRSASPIATQLYPGNPWSQEEINPLLQAKFKGLFDSVYSSTEVERYRYRVLALDRDATLLFWRVLWAAGVSREAYLRPEASWRGLSPTFGVAPRIRHLDIVKHFLREEGPPVSYLQVELPESGLSMGLLHDILLCEETLYGHDMRSWQLLVGQSLKSFDVLYRWGCFIIELYEPELVTETADGALLFVRGGYRSKETQLGRNERVSRRLMNAKPKFLPWQGPFIDPEETDWL
ncbi:hypothetical protein F5B22DRAFT_603856 [Xylaria bambusicola]|uniref:uncharacterized protein n=1 Tax=Xylaria bambusicola TaxID=326684 RepID=UPI0020074F3F|nr:uncharacterized protein F5B22DRAFT_603856 [Xylaria bambusicola]KAI0517249.1 hypothetical protein F5B22DRAFT_603856 [Xylaria bambusicola]